MLSEVMAENRIATQQVAWQLFFSSTIAGVVNDLPRLWFSGCVVKGVVTVFPYARISAVSLATP